MRILISNDDGIDSIGLLELAKEMKKLGEVTVVAPHQQKSAFSHSMTIHGHLRIEERNLLEGVKAYALWGTPVDCVHVGIRKLCKEKPDIVVAGINQGPNLGTDLIYSGTVGAAREAFIHEVPAIAVSLCSYTDHDFSYCAALAREITEQFVNDPLNKECFLNLNVPSGKPKGIRVCSTMGWLEYDEGYKTVILEDGNTYLEVADSEITNHFSQDDPDVDLNAIEEGYASLTPLMIDQISHNHTEILHRKYSAISSN